MKDRDHIELVLARLLAVKATGRPAIAAATLVAIWVSALAFAYVFLR